MKIKKHVLFILCCCTLCYQVSDTKFIEALPGETIVLKYKLNATYADWYGPWYDNTEIRYPTVINALDRYGENKTWNVTQYSSDSKLRNSLPQKNRLHIAGQGLKGEFYLEIRNVSVDDAGLYLCKIYNLAAYQSLTTRIFIVHLKYIPDLLITFEPSMLIYEGSSLRLCCLSNIRFPNETILWLNTKVGRQIRLPPSTACLYFVKISRNDSGIYTCKAEYEGQKVTTNITLNVLHISDLLITFEPSMSIYEGSSLRLCCLSNTSLPNETIGWFNTKIDQQDRPNPTTACIHFVKISHNDSGIYTCTAEQDGHKFIASIPLEVLPNISFEENTLSVKDIVIIVLLILIAAILIITGAYILFLKRRYRKRFIETINIQAEEDISTDSAHYSDIIEVNNVLTTSQENNSHNVETNDTEAENIIIAQMSAEQNSSLSNSNSNSDTTEHLNSGYEHPYTTLVANNDDEDEHVYDVSKQKSAIENILLSRNAASEPFVEIIEQDLSSDIIRTHFWANEGQENVKLNDNVKEVIAKDNGSHPSSFLSKKYEPEYINLSLKQ